MSVKGVSDPAVTSPCGSAGGAASASVISQSREVTVFYAPSWPNQCSPLSTVFDLIKVADEERHGLPGPIVAVDR